MLERSKENHLYSTIPPTYDDHLTYGDCCKEPNYKEQYELLFGNILEENREFIDYEDNYINYLLKSTE